MIVSRVKEVRQVRAGDLVPNPKNYAVHSDEQRSVIKGLLNEVGYVNTLPVFEKDGKLVLIDGHMRTEETPPDTMVPVAILDVTEDEADKILATLDPVGAMKEIEDRKYSELLASVKAEDDAVNKLLDDLAEEHAVSDAPTEFKKVEAMSPPKMTWCLIGLPTVRFGEIASTIQALAAVPDITLETVVNDTGAEAHGNGVQTEGQPLVVREAGPAAAPAPQVPQRGKRR